MLAPPHELANKQSGVAAARGHLHFGLCTRKSVPHKEQKRDFYLSVANLGIDGTVHALEAVLSTQTMEEEWAEGGVFLPIGVWQTKGFDIQKIQEKSGPEDLSEHPVLGTVYRVRLQSSTFKRKRALTRESRIRAPTKLPSVGSTTLAIEDGDPNTSSSSSSDTSSSSSDDKKKKNKSKKSKKDKKKAKKAKKDKKKKDTKDKKKPQDDSHMLTLARICARSSHLPRRRHSRSGSGFAYAATPLACRFVPQTCTVDGTVARARS